MPPLILGSSSVYRANQLKQLGLPFTQMSPYCDEDQFKSLSLSPEALAERLALEKAKCLSSESDKAVIITGDQLIHFGGEILGKAGSLAKAKEQLSRLNGKTHNLVSAVAVVHKDQSLVHIETAELTMRKLSEEQIQRYIQKENPIDCAGSYKIESYGIGLFEKIETKDFTSITGLPLLALCRMLSKFGYTIP